MIRIQNHQPFTSTIDRLINELIDFDGHPQKSSSYGNAMLNIYEREDDFLLEVIAPGHEKKNFSVAVENEMLVIEANVSQEENNQKIKTIRSDYKPGNFRKMVHLDRNVVGEPAEATYENGLLRIVLPKLKKSTTQRMQIQIN